MYHDWVKGLSIYENWGIEADSGWYDIIYQLCYGSIAHTINVCKDSGVIPVLMVDTNTDKYYRVTETGNHIVLPYDEDF